MINLKRRLERLEQSAMTEKQIPVSLVVMGEGGELPPLQENVGIQLVVMRAGQELPPQHVPASRKAWR